MKLVQVNEEFQFPLARKISPEETVEVLIVQVGRSVGPSVQRSLNRAVGRFICGLTFRIV